MEQEKMNQDHEIYAVINNEVLAEDSARLDGYVHALAQLPYQLKIQLTQELEEAKEKAYEQALKTSKNV